MVATDQTQCGRPVQVNLNWKLLVAIAMCTVGVLGVLGLIIALPPFFVDTNGLNADQRISAQSALRNTLVTALAGIAVVFGTYFTARTLGHQRDVLHETMRQNRAIEEVQLRAQLAASKAESALKFMEWFRELPKGERSPDGKVVPSARAQELFEQWTSRSWTVDSDQTIREFQELIAQLLTAGGKTTLDAVPFQQFGRVMMALRRDAGNIHSTLDEGHALRYLLKPEDWHIVPQVLDKLQH